MSRATRRVTFLGAVLLICTSRMSSETAKRPLMPDDLSRLEDFGKPLAFNIVVSPDGKSVAFVLKRPALSSKSFGFQLGGYNRADIWVTTTTDGHSRNITNGATDDSGFWLPKWSPDGRHLAMLSTRGGNIRAWLWDRQSGKLAMLSERAVSGWSLEWLSNDELALAVLPDGIKATNLDIDHRIAELTNRNWLKAWKGQHATASVLESGARALIEKRIHEQLLIVNVVSGKDIAIATALHFQDLRLSPDRHTLAYLKQIDVWRPDPNQTPETHYFPEVYQLEIAVIEGEFRTKTMAGVVDVFGSRIGWSPDSREIAVLGYATHAPSEEVQAFRCDVNNASCRPASGNMSATNTYAGNRVTGQGAAARGFLWYGKHDLLVYGALQGTTSTSSVRQLKWWAVDEAGNVRPFLSERFASKLIAESNEAGIIGLVDGSIWRVDASGRLAQNLTAKFGKTITSVVWPQSWALSDASAESELIFGVHRQSTTDLYSLDLKSGSITLLEKPSTGAELAAFDEKSKMAVFAAADRNGTFLWLRSRDQKINVTALETNAFLRDVYEGDMRRIEYHGLDGQDLKGWIILPFGFHEGKRYPVVVWVYAGVVFGDDPPTTLTHINEAHPLNLQLLASHGYVVLMPSMPIKSLREGGDTYSELTTGVLPAVDKLVELGIADPQRLGLMGHSYGGYSTYGIVTETSRFKAAVALAGVCNLVSFYGTFDPRERYTPFAQDDLFRIQQEEAEIGGPPWKNSSRYLRNSPITFADKVQTPLLIMQGDLDYVPIQQGEECFTALYRQNKRARFVRYWGEDHIFESPANIRDMWQQTYSWFDEFLTK